MSWFSRRKPKGEFPEEVGLADGPHRSPGLAALSNELDARPVEAILDLGTSSPENLAYMSRYCGNIVIRDLVSAATGAPRASLFQISPGVLDAGDNTRYDVILLWDLLHYVEPAERQRFTGRLIELARPGALMLLLASGSATIPLTPVRFKIRDRESLTYEVHGERRHPSPQFKPREVEKLMPGFRPVRFFQLRNGLQEFLLQKDEAPGEADGKPVPEQPGDWY